MTAKSMSSKQSALVKARDRRRQLDRARDEQDQRIEEATASALIALECRVDAQRALEKATGEVGECVRTLLAEDVSAERTAALLELDVSEVRRLVKATPAGGSAKPGPADADRKATVTSLGDAGGGGGAQRRAG